MALICQNDSWNAVVSADVGGGVSPRIMRFLRGLDSGSAPLDWAMLSDCKQSDGSLFRVLPSIRSYDEQCETYKRGRIVNDRKEIVGDSYRRIRGEDKIVYPSAVASYAWGGESYHNYGLAVDIVIRVIGEPAKNVSVKLKNGLEFDSLEECYKAIGLLKWAEECGLSWGGFWSKPYDPVHFEDEHYKLPINPTAKQCSFKSVSGADVSAPLPGGGGGGSLGSAVLFAVCALLGFLFWGCLS